MLATGSATFGAYELAAVSRLSVSTFLAKINASNGEVLWARVMGNCSTDEHTGNHSHTVGAEPSFSEHHRGLCVCEGSCVSLCGKAFRKDDPRDPHMDTLGACTAQVCSSPIAACAYEMHSFCAYEMHSF